MTSRPRPVRLGPRSTVTLLLTSAVGVVGFGWPLLASPDSGLAHNTDAPWLFALLLPLLLAVVLAEISSDRGGTGMDAKSVAMLGVLAAVGAALRPVGAGTAGIEPMFFLLVLAGRVLGPGFGFVLGALTMFASALLTGGVGPWLPFQMLAMGWVCLGAGLLPRAETLRGWRERLMLTGYGALAALAYGLVMNLQGWPYLAGMGSAISFVPGDPLGANLGRYLTYCVATSLGWDVPRAIFTAAGILLLGSPIMHALRRATRRANFAAAPTFRPGGTPGTAETAETAETEGAEGAEGETRPSS